MKKILIVILSLASMIAIIGCSKELTQEDIDNLEQAVANRIAEDVAENKSKWSQEYIDGHEYKYRLLEYENNLKQFKEVKVMIEKLEDENYKMLVGFYYKPLFGSDSEFCTMFTFILDEDVDIRNLQDAEMKDLNNIKGVTIVEMNNFEGDELYSTHIREGYRGIQLEDEEEGVTVHAIEEKDGYRSADEFFTINFSATLGNLENIDY